MTLPVPGQTNAELVVKETAPTDNRLHWQNSNTRNMVNITAFRTLRNVAFSYNIIGLGGVCVHEWPTYDIGWRSISGDELEYPVMPS